MEILAAIHQSLLALAFVLIAGGVLILYVLARAAWDHKRGRK